MRRIGDSFTTRARCLLAGGATATLCGMLFGATDLVRAGLFVVAVPLVAALVVNRSQVTIASRRSVTPTRVAVGESVEVQLTVSNRAVLPIGSLMLEDHLPDQLVGKARFSLDGLSGRESRTVAYRIPAVRRGHYRSGPLRVRLTDPFGLIEVTRSFATRAPFVVTPAVDPLPPAQPPYSLDVGENVGSHSIGTHGADDASTREYRHGDDLRKIHWRSTARTGALMVRHEERPWQGHTSLLLDLRAVAHEASSTDAEYRGTDARETNSLEWAISAVASIGNQMLRAGRDVSLIADSGRERLQFASSTAFVDHLAEVGPSAQPDLRPVVAQLRAAARDSTVVAVLGQLDRTSVQAVADAHARGSAVAAFAILLDTATWRRAGSSGRNLSATGSPTAQVADRLRAAGWWVVVASAGDPIPTTWTRLLRQRSFATGGMSAEWTAPRMPGGAR